jgi:hypothetical protein
VTKKSPDEVVDERQGAPRRRTKAAPFKRRIEDALEAAKAAGYGHLKVKTPDGASYEFELSPVGPTEPVNDFDRPPNPTAPKRGNART